MDSLIQDLRYGARRLFRAPAFTAAAVLTLALGIGANTAMFSVVQAVLRRPPPFPDPDRLVRVRGGSSAPDLEDLGRHTRACEGFAGYRAQFFDLPADPLAERLEGALVSGHVFRLFGVPAARGRVLEPADDRAGGEKVLVVSDSFWRKRMGAAADALDRTVRFVSGTYRVVGVMPPGFALPQVEAEVWAPLRVESPEEAAARGAHSLAGFARIRPESTFAQAQEEADALARRLAAVDPVENRDRRYVLMPLHAYLVRDVRSALLLLFGAVALVLLIAAVNVVNLLLARAADRQREMAVRTSLGAGRARLLRQLLVESLLLASLGGVAGLFVGGWTMELVVGLGRGEVPGLEAVRLDLHVLAFTAGVALLSGIAFGLVPGLHASAERGAPHLKEGARGTGGPGRDRLRRLLVASEIALAVVLLAGAGLLLRSLHRLQSVDPGFDTRGLLTFNLTLPVEPYREIPRRTAFFEALQERLRALPGVTAVGATSELPFGTGMVNHNFVVEGAAPVEAGREPEVFSRSVSSRYFETMAIPIRRGRAFATTDTASSVPVGIVNEAAVRELFHGRDPVGQRVAWARDDPRVWMTVVGVAADIRASGLDEDESPALYTPIPQERRFWKTWMNVAVRTPLPAAALLGAIKSEIGRVDRNVPVTRVSTMDDLLARSVARRRFILWLLGAFAMVAVALAAVGIEGVMAYTVSRRTREIGVRMALGARREDVLRLVLGQTVAVTAAGVAGGTLAALALRRFVASLLYGIAPTDPVTFAAVAALLALVALGAGYVPARRAARVDPAVALRSE